jgi:hypothetical protein
MNNIKEKIKQLEKEKIDLFSISEVSFTTKEEGEKYIKENYEKLQRLNELEAEIRLLKYELMSPNEQAEHDEFLRKLKLKAEGKKFW